MNQTFKAFLIVIIFILVLFAQKMSGPVIKIENAKHQFNLVQQNTVLEHHFKIQNVGDDTLKILKVRPG